MTLQDFLAQCDDATLDYIDESILPHLITIDNLNKMRTQVADLRASIAEVINWAELNSKMSHSHAAVNQSKRCYGVTHRNALNVTNQPNSMVLLSPTLWRYSMNYNGETIIENNIDFWYDSLNDCYNNSMPIDMVLTYIEAITDEDSE